MALGGRSKNAKRSILRADEMSKALDLKRAGLSLRQIAKALNCGPTKAYKLIDEGRKSIPVEARDALVHEVHERQLAIVAAHWSKRHIPEHAKVIQAADQFLSRLLGLYAPTKVAFDMSRLSDETLRAISSADDDALRAVLSGANPSAEGGGDGGDEASSGAGAQDGRDGEPEPDGSGPVG